MQLPSEQNPFADGRTACRLHTVARARLERGEELVCWTRAWVSIDGQWNLLLAARTRDFAVLTTRRLMLWSTGFFTRQPRRRVLADRLDELTIERDPPLTGRRLRVSSIGHRRLRFDVASGKAGDRFACELIERVEQARPPEAGETEWVP